MAAFFCKENLTILTSYVWFCCELVVTFQLKKQIQNLILIEGEYILAGGGVGRAEGGLNYRGVSLRGITSIHVQSFPTALHCSTWKPSLGFLSTLGQGAGAEHAAFMQL